MNQREDNQNGGGGGPHGGTHSGGLCIDGIDGRRVVGYVSGSESLTFLLQNV